jgi:hypothetical protein
MANERSPSLTSTIKLNFSIGTAVTGKTKIGQ